MDETTEGTMETQTDPGQPEVPGTIITDEQLEDATNGTADQPAGDLLPDVEGPAAFTDGYQMPAPTAVTDSGLSLVDIAIAVGSVGLIGAGALVIVLALRNRGFLGSYWVRSRIVKLIAGAVLLGAGIGLFSQLPAIGAPEPTSKATSSSEAFTEWVSAKYALDIGPVGYEKLRDGGTTVVAYYDQAIEVHLATDQEGLSYLFNGYGDELPTADQYGNSGDFDLE